MHGYHGYCFMASALVWPIVDSDISFNIYDSSINAYAQIMRSVGLYIHHVHCWKHDWLNSSLCMAGAEVVGSRTYEKTSLK